MKSREVSLGAFTYSLWYPQDETPSTEHLAPPEIGIELAAVLLMIYAFDMDIAAVWWFGMMLRERPIRQQRNQAYWLRDDVSDSLHKW